MNAGIPKDYEWYRHNGTKEDMSAFAKTTYEPTEALSLFGDMQYRIINYSMTGNDDDLQPSIKPIGGLFQSQGRDALADYTYTGGVCLGGSGASRANTFRH